jgi:hypothetical protein
MSYFPQKGPQGRLVQILEGNDFVAPGGFVRKIGYAQYAAKQEDGCDPCKRQGRHLQMRCGIGIHPHILPEQRYRIEHLQRLRLSAFSAAQEKPNAPEHQQDKTTYPQDVHLVRLDIFDYCNHDFAEQVSPPAK